MAKHPYTNKSLYRTAIVSKILIVIFTLFSTAMINRCLGVALKGEYAYIINWVSILVTVFSFGIGQTYSTYHREHGKDPLNTFVALLLIQSGVVGIIAVFADLLGVNYDICWALFITAFSVLRSNILYVAAIEDVRKRDLTNIVYKTIYTILITVAFVLNTDSLDIMLALYVADEVITIGGTFLKYRLRPDFRFLKDKSRSSVTISRKLFQIYSLGFVSMLMFLMINLNYNLDIIMLEHLSDNYSVGLYSVAVNLANLLFLIPDAFKDVLFHKTAREDSIQDITSSIKINILLDIILITGFAIFGKLFISIMYGDDFLGSFPITIILFFGSLSMVIYKMVHPLYISKGKQKTVFLILLASVIFNCILNLILIPLLNTTGAAIASVSSYTVCSVIFLIVFCKDYHVNPKDTLLIKKSNFIHLKDKLPTHHH